MRSATRSIFCSALSQIAAGSSILASVSNSSAATSPPSCLNLCVIHSSWIRLLSRPSSSVAVIWVSTASMRWMALRFLTPETGFRGDPDVFAVQVVQGRLSTAYRMDDLIYEYRNPRSDVMLAGYGLSEVELLVKSSLNPSPVAFLLPRASSLILSPLPKKPMSLLT